jgi:hypothetical protein
MRAKLFLNLPFSFVVLIHVDLNSFETKEYSVEKYNVDGVANDPSPVDDIGGQILKIKG